MVVGEAVGLFGFIDGFFEVSFFFEEETLVGAAEAGDVIGREATALEADLIDGSDAGGISVCDGERRNVLHHFGESTDDGVCTNSAELVHS